MARALPIDGLVSYPEDLLRGGVLPLYREVVGVFYSPSQLDFIGCLSGDWLGHNASIFWNCHSQLFFFFDSHQLPSSMNARGGGRRNCFCVTNNEGKLAIMISFLSLINCFSRFIFLPFCCIFYIYQYITHTICNNSIV